MYYVFFLDHNFTAAFAFLPSSSSKFVRVQRHFHNIKSIPTNLLSILRKCPALIWLINIKNRRKRVSSFCLSRINEILINLKKISGRVRVLIKILSVFQSLKICKFNNLTLSLPWNQNPDSVVNGLTSLFKNSDGKGYKVLEEEILTKILLHGSSKYLSSFIYISLVISHLDVTLYRTNALELKWRGRKHLRMA